MSRRSSQLSPGVLRLLRRVAGEDDPDVRAYLLGEVEQIVEDPDVDARLGRLVEFLEAFEHTDLDDDDLDDLDDDDDDDLDDDEGVDLDGRVWRGGRQDGHDVWWPPPAGQRGRALSPPRQGTRFGATWWGRAWVEALEQRARLDPNRLPRGRSYARSGAVGPLTLAPGEVRAQVQGTRPAPYTVRLRVREFSAEEWRTVLGAIAARAAHAAALLDGDLEPDVAGDVDREGIALLPVAGEIGPSCSCPDWADPCKHAAAVCYLVADRLDEDPFTILLLRGRSREQVLAGLRTLRSAGAGEPATPPPPLPPPEIDGGIAARTVLTADRSTMGSLPLPPPPPPRPGPPASPAVDPPPDAPVRADDLQALAADAARRAWELAHGMGDGGLGLSVEADLARLAAHRLGAPGFDGFAARAGTTPRALMRRALAWHVGGRAALEVLEGPAWQPPSDVVEEAATAVLTVLGRASVRSGRVTHRESGIQLRYGRDGLWYLLTRRSGAWEMHHPPDVDPRRLVALVAPVSSGHAGS